MQRFVLTLGLLLAVLPWPPPANAGENIPSTKKLGKNYFVVREPNSSDCKVEAKKVPKDLIMVGKSHNVLRWSSVFVFSRSPILVAPLAQGINPTDVEG